MVLHTRPTLDARVVLLPALVGGLVVLISSALTGCMGDRCSPGQVLRDRRCMPLSVDGAGPDDGGADAGAEGFAAPCSGSDDCTGKADFCVVFPGSPVGYCTYQDCQQEPDSCPTEYTCVDLSKFLPTLPRACIDL